MIADGKVTAHGNRTEAGYINGVATAGSKATTRGTKAGCVTVVHVLPKIRMNHHIMNDAEKSWLFNITNDRNHELL